MRKISNALREYVTDAKKRDSYWVEATKLQFALALEDRRKAADMTYKALAEKLGSSAAYISKVFRGDSNMTIESMVKLARATGGHLVVRIADSEVDAGHWDISKFPTKLAAGPSRTTTEPTVTVVAAMNDERFALAA